MSDIFDGEPTILSIAQMGNPVLRKKTELVTAAELKDQRTQFFIDSMIATMREFRGAGLAATQVYVSKRILVVEARGVDDDDDEGSGEKIPLTVLINPEIISFSKEIKEGWEGCLSVREIWGRVKRSTAITVRGMTREGKETEIKADGFLAVVLQHEIDHLYGKIFLDRMEEMSTLCFTAEYRKYLSD
jgi:peptide deformylase